MRSLFSAAGRKAITALPESKTLLAFDFDGTLAPIVTNPEDAFTRPELLPLLKSLSKQSKVTVISGRAIKDLKSRMKFKPDMVVGNHGLEGLKEFAPKATKAKVICRKWVAQLKRDFKELPPHHGLVIEDKVHSLSLHYRLAKKSVLPWLEEEIDNLWPEPRVIPGHKLYNLVPTGSPHKGIALKALMKRYQCTHAIFVGDDDTDEDAFGISKRVLSIRVGKKRGSDADFYIEGPEQMVDLLRALIRSN